MFERTNNGSTVDISYGRTVSHNFQGQRADVRITIDLREMSVKEGEQLTKALVNHRLGEKIGMKRSELDGLVRRYTGDDCMTWDRFVGRCDERL